MLPESVQVPAVWVQLLDSDAKDPLTVSVLPPLLMIKLRLIFKRLPESVIVEV